MPNHIKIYGVKPRIQYIANGNLKKYEFPFAIFKTSDIDVYFNDKLQDQSTYSVFTTPDLAGGEVSFETAPTNGTIITIIRNLSIERTTDFQEGGALRANVLNDELDYQIACQQQIADNLNRSMVLPPYATDLNVDLTLPTPSAGKAIVWNTEGTNLENSTVKINELESTLRQYKETAEESALIATQKAELTTEKAGIATQKADIATEKADIATNIATEVSNALSIKANKDMDNLSTTGKKNVAYFGMPATNSISLSFVSVGVGKYSYTAPSNGYFSIGFVCGTSGSVVVVKLGGSSYEKVNNAGYNASLNIPCAKGNKIEVEIISNALHSISWQNFFYAKGEV